MNRARTGLRDRWRAEVYRTSAIGDACRVLLLHLSDHMTDAGRVSIPRDRLADRLDVAERRITARITEAVRAGFLARCGGGYNNVTAMYEATIPPLKVAAERPPSRAEGGGIPSTFSVHLQRGNSGAKVAAERPPNARVTKASRQRDVNECDARDERQHRLTELRTDERAGSNSTLAAVLLKLDGRRPACTGLRTAA